MNRSNFKPLTTRAKFERWAKRQDLPLNTVVEVTRNGPRKLYAFNLTAIAWKAWAAATRQGAKPT